MEKLKEVLVNSLGTVGYVIWNVLLYVFCFLPVLVLDIPWWAVVIVVLCIVNIPFLGRILYLASWVWSFVIIISEPISGFSIFYFIVLGIYVFVDLLPSAMLLITAVFEKKNEEPEEMPLIDINGLVFSTEEEARQMQEEYAKEMAEYIKRNKLWKEII